MSLILKPAMDADEISQGSKVWVTQEGRGRIYTVKKFIQDPSSFRGTGMYVLISPSGNEERAHSAFVNKI